MSNPPGNPFPTQAVDYGTPQRAASGMAVASMALGIAGVLTACFLIGIPLAWVGLVLGIIALVRANKDPLRYGGRGFAITGIITGILGGVAMVPLLIAILLPSLGKSRELANRSYCAANMRGICQSMIVYSAENNDQYPVLPYAAYSSANNGTSTSVGALTTVDTNEKLFPPKGKGLQDGSPLAAQFTLVTRDQVAPKQYICKSDAFGTSPALVKDVGSNYYTNFQSANQLSYSFAYPYTRKGEVGAWWTNTTDSSQPVMADMAPLNGTGAPARNVSPGAMPSVTKSWNSGNHQGDGENVGFADAHTEFSRRPDIGQSNDNIYSDGGTAGISEFGGTQPRSSPLSNNATSVPYDIYMVPARDLGTGGF